MFSGIVEATGRVIAVREEQGNKHFTIEAPFTQELRIDQSIAHNGVCLTVVELEAPHYTVTAIRETLIKSNLGELREGDLVNLERSMRPDALLDGHIVQGHVDQTARCTAITEADGSWYYTFEYDSSAVNGVSLTVVNSQPDSFQVAIIPYTHEHTNFHTFRVGTTVNLEFDIVGKYITKLMQLYRVK